MKSLSPAEALLLQEVTSMANAYVAAQRHLEIGQIIRLFRRKLRMSQEALALRAATDQATISRIETNQLQPTFSLLQRIAAALECKPLLVLIPVADLDGVLRRQARQAAEKRVDAVLGTMDLEAQGTDPQLRDRMIEAEIEELLYRQSTDLWCD